MEIKLINLDKLDKKQLLERSRHLDSKYRVYNSALMTAFVLLDIIKLKVKALKNCKDKSVVLDVFINSVEEDIDAFEQSMILTGLYEKPVTNLEELNIWLNKFIERNNIH